MDKPLIALGGATGSGKTALAIELAKQFPQLVILSADSRQVYKKLNIGSAKVGKPGKINQLTGTLESVWVADGVPQYLIDIAEPNTLYTLAQYQKAAYRLIEACWRKNKIPFLVGGTGLYLQSITQGYVLEEEPNYALRDKLDALSLVELQHLLHEHGASVPQTDQKNKRRVIRALERILGGKSAVGRSRAPLTERSQTYILTPSWDEQKSRAPDMVQERLELGLIDETKHLLNNGIEKDWLHGMGLSYRLVIDMLNGEFPERELKQRMVNAFRQLMRRQRTWFKKMPGADLLDHETVLKKISIFINSAQAKNQ